MESDNSANIETIDPHVLQMLQSAGMNKRVNLYMKMNAYFQGLNNRRQGIVVTQEDLTLSKETGFIESVDKLTNQIRKTTIN